MVNEIEHARKEAIEKIADYYVKNTGLSADIPVEDIIRILSVEDQQIFWNRIKLKKGETT